MTARQEMLSIMELRTDSCDRKSLVSRTHDLDSCIMSNPCLMSAAYQCAFPRVPHCSCCACDWQLVPLIDWISDTRSQEYISLQSLVKCLDHRCIASLATGYWVQKPSWLVCDKERASGLSARLSCSDVERSTVFTCHWWHVNSATSGCHSSD